MMSHTPLSWGKPYSIRRSTWRKTWHVLHPKTGQLIFSCDKQADADFIFCACNSHYDLLEACKSAAMRMEFGQDMDNTTYKKLVDAIRKVEGES